MNRISFSALSMGLALLLAACGEAGKAGGEKLKNGPKLEVRADGLSYEVGAEKPFTGTYRKVDKASNKLSGETQYENGLKHGWERRWFADNLDQMERQRVWVKGEPAFYWAWWPSGNLRELSAQRSGKDFGRPDIGYGSYVKWFDDGRIKFKAHYDENFLWHGHALDYDDEGKLMWDAEFKNGIYVKGVRPPDAPDGVKKVEVPTGAAAEES